MISLSTALFGINPTRKEQKEKAQKRMDSLAIPKGSLGVMTELAVKLAAISESMTPSFDKKEIFVMAGDHGVVAEGVSAFSKEVTQEMVGNFMRGGAGVNAFSKISDAKVTVVDMGIDADLSNLYDEKVFLNRKVAMGTKNMLHEPAMTREEAKSAIEIGINRVYDAVNGRGTNLIATGDMGIGNTTSSTAILAAISGLPAETITGRGTGLNQEGVEKKASIIRTILSRRRFSPNDSLGILSKVGGYEIAGICGLVLGAAYCKIPVVVDGYISTAGAMLAYNINPAVMDYMIFAHVSNEQAHIKMLEEMEATPLLHLDMRLGEGTGAALALPLVDAATMMLKEMLTFEEAKVTPGNN